MTYLIGVILVLLLIALILIFRPPKPKPYQDAADRESLTGGSKAEGEQLDLGAEQDSNKTVDGEEELELVFGETKETVTPGEAGHVAEEEFDLALEEEGDTVQLEEVSTEAQPAAAESGMDSVKEVLPVTEEEGSDEYDEDIPFIDEGASTYERKGGMDVAPALVDIPDDYVQVEEDETPDELAERLEYFLGEDKGEPEPELDEPAAEQVDDQAEIEEEVEAEDETVETEEVVQVEPEADLDRYSVDLHVQEERLRGEMNDAIENRETGKLGRLEVALENLCVKQVDPQSSFQQQKLLHTELNDTMTEIQQALPGFHLETAQTSLHNGEYETVRTLLTETVTQLDASPQLAARNLYQWGRIEEDRGELAMALEMYTKAHASDEDHPDYLYAAGRLARITGDTDNAVSWLEKRVNTGQEKGEESVELAKAEHELARALAMAEENDRVEPLLLSAKEKIEKLLGNGHSDLGPVLCDLGGLYESSARYEQAEPFYKQALEVTEQNLDSDDPRLGATLNKLAGLYEELEQEKKSEPLYTRALEIKQKVLGENHPDVGTIMGHLANLLKLQGKYDKAEPMFRKSLEIAEVALGKDHPNLAVVLNDMAELYTEMGNEAQAEHFQERAFSLFGLPGMGDGFVEMDKDTDFEVDDDNDQTVAGK